MAKETRDKEITLCGSSKVFVRVGRERSLRPLDRRTLFSETKQTETHPSVTDNPLLRIIFRKGECVRELQAGIERWESYVSRYEKKMKDKLDDEIKLAGQESLVPEELEKHLILNSNRL